MQGPTKKETGKPAQVSVKSAFLCRKTEQTRLFNKKQPEASLRLF
jgi:hypothetical protein